ncbi:MAG TPA: NAD(P)H-hydrate dehydratase [Pyrinomonadaceae bacterium]|nr:NAD(P)H-hydrate dehydratase [Pyrinomonadaceae bacterium]
MPVPRPEEGGSKEERGRVLVVGGAPEMPGPAVLSATAALRAGAGKLRVATVRSVAPFVAQSVPESRVYALAETRAGAVALSAAGRIVEHASEVQACVVGPGLTGGEAIVRLFRKVLPRVEGPTLVVDADALSCLKGRAELLHALGGKVILTPHAIEMAELCGGDEESVKREPALTARRVARELRAVVALKGRETFVASPEGDVYVNRAGNVGLATSGSGDVLSGLIAGLAARGATPLVAAVWGVHLHALAGERLARRLGPLGYLARELLNEIPGLLGDLS